MTGASRPDAARQSLADVDVVVPVRIDSDDRLQNLDIVLTHFEQTFADVRVWVLEHASAPQARDCAAAHAARYHFIESGGCFHKSRVLNLGIALADRPYVLLYDCDVLVRPAALLEARDRLRDGRLDFVYPYNGILLQIGRERVGVAGPAAVIEALPQFIADRSSALPDGVEFLHGTRDEPSSGAALMANRRALVLAGGYNENIVSYGCEDTELATRLDKLGTRVGWLDAYSAYHVAHRRGDDSHYNNYHGLNLAEWNKVRAMDCDALAEYVRNGFRELRLDSRTTLVVKNTPTEFSLRTRASEAVALDDVAFVLPVAAASASLRAWVEDFLDRVDAGYDNFELFLLEIGGYGFQSSSHRDHVLYAHAPAGRDWLRPVVEQTSRPIICLCSPFTDVSPDALLGALDQVRGAPTSCASVPSRAPEGLGAARGGKVADVLMRSLPVRGDALVLGREAYLKIAVQERDPQTVQQLDLAALRLRLETAAAERRGAR